MIVKQFLLSTYCLHAGDAAAADRFLTSRRRRNIVTAPTSSLYGENIHKKYCLCQREVKTGTAVAL